MAGLWRWLSVLVAGWLVVHGLLASDPLQVLGAAAALLGRLDEYRSQVLRQLLSYRLACRALERVPPEDVSMQEVADLIRDSGAGASRPPRQPVGAVPASQRPERNRPEPVGSLLREPAGEQLRD